MKWELESLLENTENEIRLLGVGAPTEDSAKQSLIMGKVFILI
jgi:hypothetical protein